MPGKIDAKADLGIFNGLLENSIPERHFPGALQEIFDQEYEEYFDGRITREMLIDRLDSRVWLYLQEQQ